VIVFENGRSGFLGEHCRMDGTPTLRMNEFMLATLATGKADLGPPRTASTGTELPEPTELKFTLDGTGQVKRLVKEAEDRFDALISAHDLHVRAPLPCL
jgi:carnitine O-acetyltransferase